MLTDIGCVRQDAKKGPRSTMASDRRWFFQVTAELQRMPIDSSASISMRTECDFVDSTLLPFRFLFCISAECSSFFFFFEIVVGLATNCPVKEKFGHEKVGFNWTRKRWACTSLSNTFVSWKLNLQTEACSSSGRSMNII